MASVVDAIFVTSNQQQTYCVQVYDANTGGCIKEYKGVLASPRSLQIVGPCDYVMCAALNKPFLQSWFMSSDEKQHVSLTIPGVVTTMAVSSVGPKYCVVAISEKLYIYKLSTGCLIGIIARHYQPVTCICFTSCGNYFCSGGDDGFLYLWSKASLVNALHKADRPQVQPYFTLGQHSNKITDIHITSAGRRGLLVSTSLDYSSKVFDLTTGQLRHNIISEQPLTCVTANALGSQVFLADVKGGVLGVNLLPHRAVGDIQTDSSDVNECHTGPVESMALTSNGNALVTGGQDGNLKVWSVVLSGVGQDQGAMLKSCLVPLRTIAASHGAITNLLLIRMEKEVFETLYLNPNIRLAPFNSSMSPLEAPLTIPTSKEKAAPFPTLQQFLKGAHISQNSFLGGVMKRVVGNEALALFDKTGLGTSDSSNQKNKMKIKKNSQKKLKKPFKNKANKASWEVQKMSNAAQSGKKIKKKPRELLAVKSNTEVRKRLNRNETRSIRSSIKIGKADVKLSKDIKGKIEKHGRISRSKIDVYPQRRSRVTKDDYQNAIEVRQKNSPTTRKHNKNIINNEDINFMKKTNLKLQKLCLDKVLNK